MAVLLTSAPYWVGDQRHSPAASPPGNRLGTHFTRDWVGLKTGLVTLQKISPPPYFNPGD